MIFLALNTDANKRRTNSKAGGNPAADFEALSEKLLKKYTGQKTKAFIKEKAQIAADEKDKKLAEEEHGFPEGSH